MKRDRTGKKLFNTVAALFIFLLWGCGVQQELNETLPLGQDESEMAEGSSDKTEPEVQSKPVVRSDDVIRIGVLATLDGVFKALGDDGVRGIEIALAEFGGEIGGKKIEIVTISTDTSYDTAYAAVEKLIEVEQVDFVIGPLSGDEGLAVKAFAKTEPNHTFLNGVSGAQNMTLRDPAPNLFRFSTDGVQWMAGLGDYVYNEQGYERIVTLGEDYSFPHDQVGGFLIEYCLAGGQVEEQFWVPLGTNNYSSVISAIPADIDAIYVALGGTDAVDFLRQYKRFGGTAPLIAGSITLDQTILGAEAVAEYVLGTASAGPIADDKQDAAWLDFVGAYQEQFPDGLGSPSLFAWGYYVNTKAALTALDAIDADLSDDQKKFQAALNELALDSPTGPISLDENRNAIANNFISVVTADESGQLFKKLVQTVPQVNQTLNLSREEYLALGELKGGYEGCAQFAR